jgi:hypothetical protein
MVHPRRTLAWPLALVAALVGPLTAAGQEPGLAVRVDAHQAEAVLDILHRRAQGHPVLDHHWTRVFESEGYRRLKQREHSLGRPFEDSTFAQFVLSDDLLARAPDLRAALTGWGTADPAGAAARAFAYLPEGVPIRATIYPVIKPATNTFVFEVRTDPAIFFYLDPEISTTQFENVLAHELHHIGYAMACANTDAHPLVGRLWLGAFGEGVAMLAAAGGPEVHPHETSSTEDRERWDRDMARFDSDLRALESFFLDVLDGRLDEAETRERAMSFFGVQGPWYTVGWGMAATIERVYGREHLVSTLCDPIAFLRAYNSAVLDFRHLPGPEPEWRPTVVWSPALLARLGS